MHLIYLDGNDTVLSNLMLSRGIFSSFFSFYNIQRIVKMIIYWYKFLEVHAIACLRRI